MPHRVLDGPVGFGVDGCWILECSFNAMTPNAFWECFDTWCYPEQNVFRGRLGLLSLTLISLIFCLDGLLCASVCYQYGTDYRDAVR